MAIIIVVKNIWTLSVGSPISVVVVHMEFLRFHTEIISSYTDVIIIHEPMTVGCGR